MKKNVGIFANAIVLLGGTTLYPLGASATEPDEEIVINQEDSYEETMYDYSFDFSMNVLPALNPKTLLDPPKDGGTWAGPTSASNQLERCSIR